MQQVIGNSQIKNFGCNALGVNLPSQAMIVIHGGLENFHMHESIFEDFEEKKIATS